MSITNRADVERIVESVLDKLSIEVNDGDYTNPNSRDIVLKLGDKVISRTHFDVVQKREYEG